MRKALHRFLFLSKALRILILSNSLVLTSLAMLSPIWAIYVQKIGGDILEVGAGAGVFALTTGLVVLIAGKVGDHTKRHRGIVSIGYLAIATGFLLYTVVNSVPMLLVAQVIIGFGVAVYSPSFDAIYSKHLDPKNAAWAWGAEESQEYFSQAIGAFVGSLIVFKFGFIPLFLIMAGLSIFSAFYSYFGLEEHEAL